MRQPQLRSGPWNGQLNDLVEAGSRGWDAQTAPTGDTAPTEPKTSSSGRKEETAAGDQPGESAGAPQTGQSASTEDATVSSGSQAVDRAAPIDPTLTAENGHREDPTGAFTDTWGGTEEDEENENREEPTNPSTVAWRENDSDEGMYDDSPDDDSPPSVKQQWPDPEVVDLRIKLDSANKEIDSLKKAVNTLLSRGYDQQEKAALDSLALDEEETAREQAGRQQRAERKTRLQKLELLLYEQSKEGKEDFEQLQQMDELAKELAIANRLAPFLDDGSNQFRLGHRNEDDSAIEALEAHIHHLRNLIRDQKGLTPEEVEELRDNVAILKAKLDERDRQAAWTAAAENEQIKTLRLALEEAKKIRHSDETTIHKMALMIQVVRELQDQQEDAKKGRAGDRPTADKTTQTIQEVQDDLKEAEEGGPEDEQTAKKETAMARTIQKLEEQVRKLEKMRANKEQTANKFALMLQIIRDQNNKLEARSLSEDEETEVLKAKVGQQIKEDDHRRKKASARAQDLKQELNLERRKRETDQQEKEETAKQHEKVLEALRGSMREAEAKRDAATARLADVEKTLDVLHRKPSEAGRQQSKESKDLPDPMEDSAKMQAEIERLSIEVETLRQNRENITGDYQVLEELHRQATAKNRRLTIDINAYQEAVVSLRDSKKDEEDGPGGEQQKQQSAVGQKNKAPVQGIKKQAKQSTAGQKDEAQQPNNARDDKPQVEPTAAGQKDAAPGEKRKDRIGSSGAGGSLREEKRSRHKEEASGSGLGAVPVEDLVLGEADLSETNIFNPSSPSRGFFFSSSAGQNPFSLPSRGRRRQDLRPILLADVPEQDPKAEDSSKAAGKQPATGEGSGQEAGKRPVTGGGSGKRAVKAADGQPESSGAGTARKPSGPDAKPPPGPPEDPEAESPGAGAGAGRCCKGCCLLELLREVHCGAAGAQRGCRCFAAPGDDAARPAGPQGYHHAGKNVAAGPPPAVPVPRARPRPAVQVDVEHHPNGEVRYQYVLAWELFDITPGGIARVLFPSFFYLLPNLLALLGWAYHAAAALALGALALARGEARPALRPFPRRAAGRLAVVALALLLLAAFTAVLRERTLWLDANGNRQRAYIVDLARGNPWPWWFPVPVDFRLVFDPLVRTAHALLFAPYRGGPLDWYRKGG